MALDAMNQVLVVAAHPDDEVLGCDRTIARNADFSDQVQVLTVAEGSTSRQQKRDRAQVRDELSALAQTAQTAGSILGAAGVDLLDLPDNRLDSLDRLDLIKRMENYIEHHQPECVFVHHPCDVNVHHRRLDEAVVSACRPMPRRVVKRLLSFEVASSTEWQPQGSAPAFQPKWFVDISDQWERKREALVADSNGMRDWIYACFLEAVKQAACWGGSQLGVEVSEEISVLLQPL